jgi:Gluconate 2-dehydrogenase subunit 3
MQKWSRRKFLETGIIGSIVVTGASRPKLSLARAFDGGRDEGRPARGLEPRERELLRIVLDEIIPATDGMPAATEVGGLEYLDQLTGRDKQVAKDLRNSLSALGDLSQKRPGTSFLSLAHAKRVETLRALESQDPRSFGALRDYAYEAYYTQPTVWKLIGYKSYPTNDGGPPTKAFNDAVLVEVRKKPKGYREVSE